MQTRLEAPRERSYPSAVADITPTDMERLFPQFERKIAAALLQLKIFPSYETLPTLSFPPTPHENRKKVPGAGYLVDELEVGKDVLYVAFMLPHSETSDHIHNDPIEEAYAIVDGEVIIQGRKLGGGSYYATYANEDHVVRTDNKSGLYIIHMRNAATIPKEKRHLVDFDESQLKQHGTLLVVDQSENAA